MADGLLSESEDDGVVVRVGRGKRKRPVEAEEGEEEVVETRGKSWKEKRRRLLSGRRVMELEKRLEGNRKEYYLNGMTELDNESGNESDSEGSLVEFVVADDEVEAVSCVCGCRRRLGEGCWTERGEAERELAVELRRRIGRMQHMLRRMCERYRDECLGVPVERGEWSEVVTGECVCGLCVFGK